MEYLIPIEIKPLEEGGFLATSPALQGFVAQRRTIAETMEIAQDVARKLIESYVEHGDPLPKEFLEQARREKSDHIKVSVPVILPA